MDLGGAFAQALATWPEAGVPRDGQPSGVASARGGSRGRLADLRNFETATYLSGQHVRDLGVARHRFDFAVGWIEPE
jgi:predicted RNA polymerase sigma factor